MNEPDRNIVDLTPHLINGEWYYDITQFAHIVRRHTSHVSMLFNQGNKTRKLNGIRVAGKPFIEVKEVEEYPFNEKQGRRSKQ